MQFVFQSPVDVQPDTLPALPDLERPHAAAVVQPEPAVPPSPTVPPRSSPRSPSPEPDLEPGEPVAAAGPSPWQSPASDAAVQTSSPWGEVAPVVPAPPIAKGLEQAGASGGVWQAPAQTEQVAWAEGLEVSLQGDASEVALVDEARGFPVPGVVPLGKWFVRARFGDAEPVVAGVVEIQGDEPLVLECKRDLGWCSVKR